MLSVLTSGTDFLDAIVLEKKKLASQKKEIAYNSRDSFRGEKNMSTTNHLNNHACNFHAFTFKKGSETVSISFEFISGEKYSFEKFSFR